MDDDDFGVRWTGTITSKTATLCRLGTIATILHQEAMEIAREADAVVLFMGLTPRIEGEDMRVDIEGFSGGDRTSIDLPDTQKELIKDVSGLGKPTVLVLLNGSALAVNWANEHVPAILEAWYPGQAAGTAIADVLFGNYNPAGRLQLPPFDDYDMSGRSYKFFEAEPLYPFGYGLSHTSFDYANLTAGTTSISAGETVSVSVEVTTTGDVKGEDVVQLYVSYPDSDVKRPIRELRGFKRLELRPGEIRTVTFDLEADDLRYWNAGSDRWALELKPVRLETGASSADIRQSITLDVE